MYQDTTRVRTDSRSLAIKGLPPSLEDFKIVHISDIQGDEYTGRDEIANYIDVVNRQNPDLIIFTGDLISYGTDFISMAARELGKAKATYGTVAVVGDHDYWAGTNTVENALEEEGVTLLRDENYTIKLDTGDSLAITGVTEVYSKASNPKTVDSLTHNLPEASVKILGSHQVEDHLITNARQNNYDMMLAGHTHGGQIHVPFLGMSFSAAERETQYVSGLYREGALPIHINNGLGFTLGPIRYGAPPTVTSIRLKKE
nr:metallophosphoesterase [Fodinibius halophilus]